MLKELLPQSVGSFIEERFNIKDVYEIRIRHNMPIYINVLGRYVPLRNLNGSIIYADKKLLDFIISRATDMSLYKYNNQIKNGYISVFGGIRIGIGGEIVLDDKTLVKTIKNFSSLTIRLPHEIKGCSNDIMDYIVDSGGVKNTIIISPPGCGKTTFLRDIAKNLSAEDNVSNILIIDEKFEIASSENGVNQLNVGTKTDILSGATKDFGFYAAIQSMRPDVVITDEIASQKDIQGLKYAINSGVKVVASCHGYNHLDLKRKQGWNSLMEDKIIERYVVLSAREGVGTVEMVLNSSLEPLYSL